MQSFTTQSHQRNYQGNVVVENPNRVSYVNQGQKRHKVRGAIATSVLALAVAVTGSLLGATTLHNQQLKHQVQALETQTAEVVTVEPVAAVEMDDAYGYPTTLELRPAETDEHPAQREHCEKLSDEARYHPMMTLEARPEDTEKRNEEKPKSHEEHPFRRHGKKLRRVPISDQEHEAQPLPAVRNHEKHDKAN